MKKTKKQKNLSLFERGQQLIFARARFITALQKKNKRDLDRSFYQYQACAEMADYSLDASLPLLISSDYILFKKSMLSCGEMPMNPLAPVALDLLSYNLLYFVLVAGKMKEKTRVALLLARTLRHFGRGGPFVPDAEDPEDTPFWTGLARGYKQAVSWAFLGKDREGYHHLVSGLTRMARAEPHPDETPAFTALWAQVIAAPFIESEERHPEKNEMLHALGYRPKVVNIHTRKPIGFALAFQPSIR